MSFKKYLGWLLGILLGGGAIATLVVLLIYSAEYEAWGPTPVR